MIKMLSNASANFPLISSQIGFSKLFLYTSQLSSTQLPNRSIEHLSAPPNLQPIYPNKRFIKLSLQLALIAIFPDIFPILKDLEKKEDQFDGKEKEACLEEDLAFDSNSNFESANNSNFDESESNNSTFSQDFKSSIWLLKKWARGLNSLIATSSTSYAREKLIQIVTRTS